MNSRLKQLGAVMIAAGVFFAGVGGYTFIKTMDGAKSLQAFSAAQGVKLSYDDAGQLVDRGTTEGAQKIRDLVTKDWGYALVDGDLNPNDPLVNTASEYMIQMGTIAYHTLNSTVTVTLPENVDYNGETFTAGDHEFANDGRYWTGFDRQHPIEGPARSMIWTGTAHALIGELGVGAVTASTLTIGLGLAGVIVGLGGTLGLLGLGLIWVARKSI